MSGHYVHVMYNVWHMYNNGNAGSLSCITCATTSLTGRSGQACHVVLRSIYPLPLFPPVGMFDNSLNVQQPRLQQPSSFAPFNTMQLKLIRHHISPINNVLKVTFFK